MLLYSLGDVRCRRAPRKNVSREAGIPATGVRATTARTRFGRGSVREISGHPINQELPSVATSSGSQIYPPSFVREMQLRGKDLRIGTRQTVGGRIGFEDFLQCLKESEQTGISRAAVRSLFPIVEEDSEPDYCRVRYDDKNSCHIGGTAVASNKEMLKSLFVERPHRDLRLWEGLIPVLRMGSVVIFWPGGPPVVANKTVAAKLPNDMTDAIGQPTTVRSGDDLLRLLREQ